MDLILEFGQGRITGEGCDGIGPFLIKGTYSTGSMSAPGSRLMWACIP